MLSSLANFITNETDALAQMELGELRSILQSGRYVTEEQNGQPVGFACWKLSEKSQQPWKASFKFRNMMLLEYIVVRDDVQRQGIGTRLLYSIEKIARYYNRNALAVGVPIKNVKAQRFFQYNDWGYLGLANDNDMTWKIYTYDMKE